MSNKKELTISVRDSEWRRFEFCKRRGITPEEFGVVIQLSEWFGTKAEQVYSDWLKQTEEEERFNRKMALECFGEVVGDFILTLAPKRPYCEFDQWDKVPIHELAEKYLQAVPERRKEFTAETLVETFLKEMGKLYGYNGDKEGGAQ
jgi:hypothetical protein